MSNPFPLFIFNHRAGKWPEAPVLLVCFPQGQESVECYSRPCSKLVRPREKLAMLEPLAKRCTVWNFRSQVTQA